MSKKTLQDFINGGFIAYDDIVLDGSNFANAKDIFDCIFVKNAPIVNRIFDNCTGIIICDDIGIDLIKFESEVIGIILDSFKVDKNSVSGIFLHPNSIYNGNCAESSCDVSNTISKDELNQTSLPIYDNKLYITFARINNELRFIGAYSGFMLMGKETGTEYKKFLKYYWFKSPWIDVFNNPNLTNDCYFNNMDDGMIMLDKSIISTKHFKNNIFATKHTVDSDVDKPLLHCNILPEPFDGNVYCSNLYLLNMNPGYDVCDMFVSNKKDLANEWMNVFSINNNSNFVWFTKNSSIVSSSNVGKIQLNCGRHHGGHKWWFKHAKDLINLNHNYIHRLVFECSYFPYHTVSGYPQFFKNHSALPSYDFSDQLIWRAIYMNKTIIIMRQKKDWINRIPLLRSYQPIYYTSNERNVTLSQNNTKYIDDKPEKINDNDYNNLLL